MSGEGNRTYLVGKEMQKVLKQENKCISIVVYGSYMDKNVCGLSPPLTFEENPCLHDLASQPLLHQKVKGGDAELERPDELISLHMAVKPPREEKIQEVGMRR